MEQDQNYYLRQNSLLNKRGQAAVEYILLLVITVSLVMGAKKAFSSLDKFINHYIGEYVICLMEYGELPSLGVSDSTLKNHMSGIGKSCDEEFAGFTFEDGRPPTGGSGPSRSKTNSSADDGGKNSSSSADEAGSNKDSSSDSGSKKSGSRRGGSKSRSSPYTRGAINRSNDFGTADASGSDEKVRVIEDDDGKKGAGWRSSSRRGSSSYSKRRTVAGNMLAEIEKTAPKKLRAPAVSVISLPGEGGSQFGPYKKVFIPPEAKKVAEREDDNSGFSFGYIIRWLIIAGMVLAIVIFFGSQIMNYSNSSE